MSKKIVTFIEDVEGRDSITHGGVVFVPHQPVALDSDEVELFPWFEGNSSFTVEDAKDETTENQNLDHDADAGASDSGADKGTREIVEEKPAVKVTAPKRGRRKAATK